MTNSLINTTTLSAEVAEAVRLRDAATKGPWLQGPGLRLWPETGVTKAKRITGRNEVYICDCGSTKDAALIAAAPSHVDLIQKLHARVRELEALIRTIDDALSE